MDITLDVFLTYVASYNQKIFPMQILAIALGLIIIVLIFIPSKQSSRMISGLLAFFCLWVAFIFGFPFALQGEIIGIATTVLFFIQGCLFIWQIFKPSFTYGRFSPSFSVLGGIFILYAMIGYAILGALQGRNFPRSLPFGLVPCPLTMFIFGVFMFTKNRINRVLLVMPLLYSLSGFFPIKMGIYEDIGLVLTGIVSTTLIIRRDRSMMGFSDV